ncbi:T9SS type A sorting domain-containing protein, partial [Bacteroidota bacterium]
YKDRVALTYREITNVNNNMFDGTKLFQNYPNPFTEFTKFTYNIYKPANVKIAIYNSLGQEIAVPVDGWQNPGEHEALFDGSGLNAGVYFYRISVGEEFYFGKMMLMR